MKNLSSRVYTLACLFTLVLIISTPCFGQSRARTDLFVQGVIELNNEILTSVTDQASLNAARSQSRKLADYVTAHAGARQLDAMVQTQALLEVLNLLRYTNTREPGDLAQAFAQSPEFMIELGLLVSEHDKPEHVLRLADTLMSTRQDQVQAFPALAAAICVVHDLSKDSKYTVAINENTPAGADPIDIFDFFVSNSTTMAIPINKLPASLLVFVVDVTESIDQLQWAHDTYRTSPGIDQRFYEIMYDTSYYTSGTPKRVTEAGNYSLEQIKKYGGVCADQTYFAMSVGKSCGIPTAYVRAQGATVSHAWVGYLEVRGRNALWNFDAGRYTAYQSLRGNIQDPQTGQVISDGRLGILGGALRSTNQQVLESTAAGKAVNRMNGQNWKPTAAFELNTKGNTREARTRSSADRLALLKITLSKCASIPGAWDSVIQIAKANEMSMRELDSWSKAAFQMAGRTHQDFSYDFLSELIRTVSDAQEQHEMWEWAFGQFRSRPDLAAGVRFTQGALWEANGKPEMAWAAYQDVVDQFLNDGPMCIEALRAMGKLLIANGKRSSFLPELQEAAQRVSRPDVVQSEFAKQSNYYKIHSLLAKELDFHKRHTEAKRIRDMIGISGKD